MNVTLKGKEYTFKPLDIQTHGKGWYLLFEIREIMTSITDPKTKEDINTAIEKLGVVWNDFVQTVFVGDVSEIAIEKGGIFYSDISKVTNAFFATALGTPETPSASQESSLASEPTQ